MSIKERTYLHLLCAEIMTMIKMADCYICGKKNISKNEIGLTKKLMGKSSKNLYCISSSAEELEVTTEELQEKIEEFKNEGCKLFE